MQNTQYEDESRKLIEKSSSLRDAISQCITDYQERINGYVEAPEIFLDNSVSKLREKSTRSLYPAFQLLGKDYKIKPQTTSSQEALDDQDFCKYDL